MTFLGFIVFSDPIKSDVIESITKLRNLGVSVKIISGDNKYVVANLAKQIGVFNSKILVGQEIHKTSFDALVKKVNDIDIFAEIEPNQKEQIILALRVSENNVVGYLGDGINDATAIHAADVGISVNSAPNVTKEASDFVLLEKDLRVLAEGVIEGRRTFANTLKYVFMATSANFGNMFSMAGASIFLPFLPLLPKQILLMNLLTDLPEMTISTDNVDPETIVKPRRWDIKFIRRFMIVFGLLSTLFDLITFGILLYYLHSTSVEQFRTTWFIESIASACIIVLIIRTARPIFRSKPNKYLIISTFITIGVAMILPFTPIGDIFGLSEIPISYIMIIGLIISVYALSAEFIKKMFYKSIDHHRRHFQGAI
jgi:P-type Mg2+ transporter